MVRHKPAGVARLAGVWTRSLGKLRPSYTNLCLAPREQSSLLELTMGSAPAAVAGRDSQHTFRRGGTCVGPRSAFTALSNEVSEDTLPTSQRSVPNTAGGFGANFRGFTVRRLLSEGSQVRSLTGVPIPNPSMIQDKSLAFKPFRYRRAG